VSATAGSARFLPRLAPRRAADPLAPGQIRWLVALIVAAQLPHLPSQPAWVSVAGIMLVALHVLLLRRDTMRRGKAPTRIPAWALGLCALAAAAGIHSSFGYLLGRESCVAFLFVLVGIKLLELRTTRDGMLLVCLASFLTVTPFFYSQSLLAALAMVPALLLIGAALEVLAWPAGAPTAGASWKGPIGRSAKLLLQGIPLAAVLFLLFPRLAVPLWGLPTDARAQSGLSDSMMPGAISELSLSDAVAFRVEFDGPVPPPQQRYWRGPVLSRFDGREWNLAPQRQDGSFVRADARPLAYTVTLEPHFKPWLFALELPTRAPRIADGPDASGDAPAVEIAGLTRSQQLIAHHLVIQPLRYRQQSILRDRYPADTALDAAENLHLPRSRNFGNPKTLAFARELRAQHPDDDGYIRTVLAWFNAEPFAYTLSPPVLGADPIDMFLFDVRRGFCEHYASAFVVLLRAAGIPARVVTGYQGGEINPRGGYMIVRQSDAHAWAEALVDGEWRRYDPTGAVAPSRIESGLGGALPTSAQVPFLARLDVGWLKAVRLTWDAVNHDWRRHVVGFNYDQQRSLWQEWKFDRLTHWQYAALISALAMAWVGALLGWLAWRRHRRDRAWAGWHSLCRRLARAGLPRLAHEGPLAYAGRAADRWPRFDAAFRVIGASYAQLRYGPVSTRADADRDRAAALARFERAIDALPGSAALRRATAAPRGRDPAV
jgi:transglutaminase-like putative cysteine protease